MKTCIMFLMAVIMAFVFAGCGSDSEFNSGDNNTAAAYSVVSLVNGDLGDKSFFDSAESGLARLSADGIITHRTIAMGGNVDDQPVWLKTLYDVSESGQYDLIICGAYQMSGYLDEVAGQYPDQKYLIYDAESVHPNVANILFKQNEMGYGVGVFAALMTTRTDFDRINPEKILGFVGGMDMPVINDFLVGFIEGARSVEPDIRVDTRYVNSFVDTATAKALATQMIATSRCDIVWGVAGLSGNGAAEAVSELGAWFIGVDSDQEQTLPGEIAAVTLTSGLKNIGDSFVWFFDQWQAGVTYWGKTVSLGLKENGVGIVTTGNFRNMPFDVQNAVTIAIQNVMTGKIRVSSAFDDNTGYVTSLRDSVMP